jgi:hypothetical protein
VVELMPIFVNNPTRPPPGVNNSTKPPAADEG